MTFVHPDTAPNSVEMSMYATSVFPARCNPPDGVIDATGYHFRKSEALTLMWRLSDASWHTAGCRPAGKDNYWERTNGLYHSRYMDFARRMQLHKYQPLNDMPPVPVALLETPRVLR
jgi:hypothetical protein